MTKEQFEILNKLIDQVGQIESHQRDFILKCLMLHDFDKKLGKLGDSLHELNLSIRATNALLSDGVITIGDLIKLSRKEILQIPGVGKYALNQIIDRLYSVGLHLNSDSRGSHGSN